MLMKCRRAHRKLHTVSLHMQRRDKKNLKMRMSSRNINKSIKKMRKLKRFNLKRFLLKSSLQLRK